MGLWSRNRCKASCAKTANSGPLLINRLSPASQSLSPGAGARVFFVTCEIRVLSLFGENHKERSSRDGPAAGPFFA